jgi:chromosome segregation ATPase
MKFGTQTLTTDQRLEELEGKIPVIQERIQAYNEALQDIKILKEDIEDIKKYMSGNQLVIEDLSASALKTSKRVDQESKYIEGMFAAFEGSMKRCEGYITRVEEKVKDNNMTHQGHCEDIRNSLKEAKNEMMKSKEFDVIVQSVTDFHQQVRNRLISHAKVHEDLAKDITSNAQAIGDVALRIRANEDDVSRIMDVVRDVPDKLRDYEYKMKDNFKSDAARLIQGIDEKLTIHSNQLISAKDVTEQIRDIISTLDGNKIDISNSNIRSMNAAKQVGIMEKKVENILLQLKSHDLGK